MSSIDNGQLGVYVDANTLRSLVARFQSLHVHLGAIRVMLEKTLQDGSADARSLEIIHGVSESTERMAEAGLHEFMEHQAIPAVQVLEQLSRCLGIEGAVIHSARPHPLLAQRAE